MRRFKRGIVWTGTLEELNSNDADVLAKGLGRRARPDLPRSAKPLHTQRWIVTKVDRTNKTITLTAVEDY